jgi:hypothetical protein
LLEAVGAVAAGVLALVVTFVVGYRATFGQPWVSLVGLVVGVVCAGVYFGVANWVGRTYPGMLDARLVGIDFLVLVFVAALCGLAGSWFGYRKSTGLGLF